jgi:eukaryotic-like serine/threonine-protein kinase
LSRRRTFLERFPWLSRVDRRIAQRVLGIGLAGFALGYLFTAILFFGGRNRPEVVTVPELREMTASAARRALAREGLEMVVGDSLPNPQVGAGRVLAQSPLPGRELPHGASVRVILSAGPQRRTVPDVRELARGPAVRLLNASGFQVRVDEEPGRLPAGRVLGLTPAPGTVTRLPATVVLRVSSGPAMIAVPQLFGMAEEEARAALEAAGLRMGDVQYEFQETPGEDAVVEQTPPAGDSVRMGTAVQVRIVTYRSTAAPGTD